MEAWVLLRAHPCNLSRAQGSTPAQMRAIHIFYEIKDKPATV